MTIAGGALLFLCVVAHALFGPAALHGVVLSQPSTVAKNAGKPCDFNRAVINNKSTAADGVDLKTVLSPYTYMDEVFHVPQAMQYAILDDYTRWDPMITTPPGAYVFAYGLVRPVIEYYRRHQQQLEGIQTAAWTVTLCRASNAVALGLIALVGRGIFQHDVQALLLVSVPPLAFSGTLFYTEALSTLACVVVLYGYIRGVVRAPDQESARRWWLAVALAGLWAITIRQTNIVWLFYVAAHNFVCVTVPRLRGDHGDRQDAVNMAVESIASPERAARTRPTRALTAGFVLQRCAAYLRDVSPVVLVAIAFGGFIVWNDFAIVLGDKTKHKPVAHWAQMPYFFATLAVFMPFSTLYAVQHTLKSARGAFLLLGVAGPLLGFALLRGPMFHEYLVADNRHFTNVLYRHCLRHETRRVAFLVPLATAGVAAFMHQTIGASRAWNAKAGDTTAAASATAGVAGELLLLACVMASCVPQGLLEPRYFIMPLVAHMCHMSRQLPRRCLVLDAMVMFAVHAAAVWVFLNRPFVAPDGSVGRFMW